MMLFGAGLLILAHNLLVELTPAAFLAQMFGMLIPTMITHLVAVTLTIYVISKVSNVIESREVALENSHQN